MGPGISRGLMDKGEHLGDAALSPLFLRPLLKKADDREGVFR